MRSSSAASLRSALTDSFAPGTLNRVLATLSPDELRTLLNDFAIWARDDQLPPARAQGGGDWTVWLMLGGRGAGKTRAGAEWVRSLVQRSAGYGEALRIALVGETFADARSVMVKDVSGLLAVHPGNAAQLRAVEAATDLGERRDGAAFLGGRSRGLARAAVPRGVV